MPLAAMLRSLADGLGSQRSVVAHIVFDALSAKTRALLSESVNDDRLKIYWRPMDQALAAGASGPLRDHDHLTQASYWRLWLPYLLPRELDRVIYLDCDLIVSGDIGPLWHLDLGDSCVAAAPELSEDARFVSSPMGLLLWQELGLAADFKQFNSGVLVMNLKRWRSELITYRAFAYLTHASRWLRWHDQEALNAVLAGTWLPLDARWNLTMRHLVESPPFAYEPPYIIHYHTASKPWHPDYRYALRELFLDHLDQTAWSGWRPTLGPLERLGRFGKRIEKAARKRRDAFGRRRATRAGRRRASVLLASRPKLLGNPPTPDSGLREVRTLTVVDDYDDAECAIIRHYLERGSDRAILAIPSDTTVQWQAFANSTPQVHLVLRDDRTPDESLRALLHWFGSGHWCLLARPEECLRFPCDDRLTLSELTAHLDAQGDEAVICLTADLLPAKDFGDPRAAPDGVTRCGESHVEQEALLRLPVTDRDLFHDRAFMADTYVAPGLAGDRPQATLRSAMPLLRYRSDMLIGPRTRSVHGARLSDTEGVLLRTSRMGSLVGLGAATPSRIGWRALVAAGLLKTPSSLELMANNAPPSGV